MAIEAATLESPALMRESWREDWTTEFLSSGCLLASGPQTVWIGWGNTRRSSSPSSSRLSLFCPDFLLSGDRHWLLFEESAEVEIELLLSKLDPDEDVKHISWHQPSFEKFANVFSEIQSRIETGELSKAVPVIVRDADVEFDVASRKHAIRKALQVSSRSPLQAYGFWTAAGDGMIGATPENLFEQVSPKELRTMALAGTRRVDPNGASLLDDSKELFEHRVVVDGIVDRLSSFGQVEVGQTQEISLPALIHLHTPISVCAAADTAFSDWVEALHPTPAIGAWPLVPGRRWLRAQDDAVSRLRFGAPFGLVPPNQSGGKCVVAIRNIQWSEGKAWLMAGCGIVAASKLEREWSELHSKLDSVQGALGV